MKKRFAILGFLMLLGVVIVGCGGESPTNTNNIDDALANQLNLPAGAVLESATISVFGFDTHGATVNVHRVNGFWTEGSVTYDNFGNDFDPAIQASFLADATQWYDIDVATLVQGWINGDFENHGILLEQGDTEYTRFFSSEYEADETLRPKLEICYSLNGETSCFTLQRSVMGLVEDSYISEQDPEFDAGSLETFFTGNLSGIVKMALLKFDMEDIVETASLGDFVWHDLDQDGLQEDGEPGIAGVVVYLTDCNGELISQTLTDEFGNYLFDNLEPGDYMVHFIAPDGFIFSPADAGDDAIDSDADMNGMTECINLQAGEHNLTVDAGLFNIPDEECGYCDGKITELTLRYLGDSSADIEVITRKDESVLFSGTVDANADFNFIGDDKHGTMGPEIKVFVDGDLNVKIHTSCSQPIEIGMIFGDFEVVDGYSRNGGKICVYDGQGEDPEDPESCECEGKVTELTLQYLGDSSAEIEIYTKGKNPVLLFSESVDSDGVFNFIGNDKHGTMGPEIKVVVDGDENVKIHTSCSQPIAIGMTFGDFEILDGYSRNGGQLCEFEN